MVEKRRGALESGRSLQLSDAGLPVGIGAPALLKLACAVRLNNRLRSSDSRPFITDSTVIRAATPSATPNSEIQVMKDTKKLCSRASE